MTKGINTQSIELTARLGRPTAQLTRQYTTPTRRCMTETKLQEGKDGWSCVGTKHAKSKKSALTIENVNEAELNSGISIDSSNWKSINAPQRKWISKDNILWIREIIIDLLVQYVEDDIQEVPALKENITRLFPFLFLASSHMVVSVLDLLCGFLLLLTFPHEKQMMIAQCILHRITAFSLKLWQPNLKKKAQGSEILEIELQHCINDR